MVPSGNTISAVVPELKIKVAVRVPSLSVCVGAPRFQYLACRDRRQINRVTCGSSGIRTTSSVMAKSCHGTWTLRCAGMKSVLLYWTTS